MAVIVLRAPGNRLADTQPLMAKVESVLPGILKGAVTFIEWRCGLVIISRHNLAFS
jgi:hypothetical protein